MLNNKYKENNKIITEKLRILHAPALALYQPFLHVKALRNLGYTADYMIWDDIGNEWIYYGSDYNLKIYKDNFFKKYFKLANFLLSAIKKYDVFHFHSGNTIFPHSKFIPNEIDLKILKSKGKKIVFHHWGCREGLLRSTYLKISPEICDVCQIAKAGACTDENIRKTGEKELKFADLIINCEPDFRDYNKTAYYAPPIIDTDFWKPDLKIPEEFKFKKNSSLIRIIHSFKNIEHRDDVKGTKYIIDAVQNLKNKGYQIELIYADKMHNKDLRYLQAQTDIAIDQLLYGWYGSTARECMALGKPVVCYIRKDLEKYYPNLPIVNANKDNITEILEKLIKDEALRKQLGQDGRKFILREHSMEVVGKKIANLYKEMYDIKNR